MRRYTKEEESSVFSTNRIVGLATIVVYTSAVFIAGYLTGGAARVQRPGFRLTLLVTEM